jgi:alpha-L-arabinofuranosidase
VSFTYKEQTERLRAEMVSGNYFDMLGVKAAKGRVLTAPAMSAHNTFAAPDAVKPAAFTNASIKGDVLTATLPSKAVVVLDLN